MIVLLAILAATCASPIVQTSPPLVSLDQVHQAPSCDDLHGCRSLWDIIRSCIITIFLCVWVSVHPNIPSPDESWPRVAIRRVGLMLATVFVPELMVAWALRQRLAAAKLARKHKGEGWTTTHGFFAIMGGFMEYDGNRPVRVLLSNQLESYSLTGNGDFPRIAKAEIEDRSKGDALSKTLVVLQTGWFVTQCIARGVQGLPVTELELVTVAFATLNFAMYLLWWDKPLSVSCGVRVYKKRQTEQPDEDVDGQVADPVGFWAALGDAVSKKLPAAIVRGPFTHGESDLHDKPWLVRVLMWPLSKVFYIFNEEIDNSMRVATFYSGAEVTDSERDDFSAAAAGLATALVFGAIHCTGWSFTFPSSAERTLWRVASISIMAIPALLTIVAFAGEALGCGILAPMIGFLTISLYILSRLVLLLLPFLSLRSLPPAAYHVVHWTPLIPHV
ncbi:hypothetical protein F5148DRAFT_981929 [Russula earlei]|uniref:Uncharacterized protein n=1 Tax=Russula earlei TaxID=71964 RepID=A0ACC0U746_9AGAM|nr:hypothetical protein F5148DRAFT_981929 [Russula earlei]